MATAREIRALLDVACPHCGAGVGSACRVRVHRRGRMVTLPITTLDGGSHDARWQAALGIPAPVRADRVAERRVAPSPRMARGGVAVLDPPTQEAHDEPTERPW